MRIFYLELKRVLKSKLTWILLALALLLSVLLAWLPTTYCYRRVLFRSLTATVITQTRTEMR